MKAGPAASARGALAAALLLCFAFGAIHAFSVVLEPMQDLLGASRSAVSLGYALAIASLTCGVFVSAGVRRWLTPARLAILCGVVGSGGLLLAAAGWGVLPFVMGFGVVFGLANSLAYSLSLAMAAHAAVLAAGPAMGLATAVYGLGAVAFAAILARLEAAWGIGGALCGLAFAVIAAGLGAGLLLRHQTSGMPVAASPAHLPPPVSPAWTARLWLVYFFGASGGLMVIAHAAQILGPSGAGRLALGPMLVNAGSIAGGVLGGLAAGRLAPRFSLGVPLVLAGLAMSAFLPAEPAALQPAALLICGLSYGMIIAAVPAVIRDVGGREVFAAVFGVVFTAWGLAGLLGPLGAGVIYDHQGHYRIAIVLAQAMMGTALVLSLTLGRNGGRARA